MLSYAMKIGLILVDNGKFTGFYPEDNPISPIRDPVLTVACNYKTDLVTITDGDRIITRPIQTMLHTPVVVDSRQLPGTHALIKAIETFPVINVRNKH